MLRRIAFSLIPCATVLTAVLCLASNVGSNSTDRSGYIVASS